MRAEDGGLVELMSLTTLTLVGASDGFTISADGLDSIVDVGSLENFDMDRVIFEEIDGGQVIRMPAKSR